MSECKCFRRMANSSTGGWIVTKDCPLHKKNALESRVKELEDWKASALQCIPNWQEIGKALGLRVGDNVSKALLPAIYNLKNEVQLWKIQAQMTRYGVDCVCEWKDSKVVSFCGAHQMAADAMADARVKSQTDVLAEKYRKLTEIRAGS